MINVGDSVGAYEIVARLRAGGMATLYLARRTSDGDAAVAGASSATPLVTKAATKLAIKVVHPHLAENPAFVRMFLEEARLSAQIRHPNVVRVEHLGEKNGTPFLVMEYVDGVSLSELVRALRRLERTLAPPLAVAIALRVADALHAAHETMADDGTPLGVVHRDVSPQNILLGRLGEVKLIDFGIAKAHGRDAAGTRTGQLRGKLSYMAPEQAFGKPVDRRTDLYALGLVLWEMLTGRKPFVGEDEFELLEQVRRPRIAPPGRLTPGLPPALDAAVMAALEPELAARPPTALAFRDSLAHAMPAAAQVNDRQLAALVAEIATEEATLNELGAPAPAAAVPGGGRAAFALPTAPAPAKRAALPRSRLILAVAAAAIGAGVAVAALRPRSSLPTTAASPSAPAAPARAPAASPLPTAAAPTVPAETPGTATPRPDAPTPARTPPPAKASPATKTAAARPARSPARKDTKRTHKARKRDAIPIADEIPY